MGLETGSQRAVHGDTCIKPLPVRNAKKGKMQGKGDYILIKPGDTLIARDGKM